MPPRKRKEPTKNVKEEIGEAANNAEAKQEENEAQELCGRRQGRKRAAAATEAKVELAQNKDAEEPEAAVSNNKRKNARAAAKVKEEVAEVKEEAEEKPASERARANVKTSVAIVPTSRGESSVLKSVRLVVEHWKALDLHKAFQEEFPNLELELNKAAPRRGAFEITAINADGKETLIWSGIKRGPPRKDKFPDAQVLVEALKNALA